MRLAVPALAVLALVCAACRSSQKDEAPRAASTYDGEGNPKIKFGGDSPGGARASSGGPGVLDYAAVPLENVVYVPWKLVGGGFKGAADGVGAAFSKDRMPIVGVLFSPINAVAGFLTGAGEGLFLSPGLVGPSDDFGHAMSRPTKHATSIWWYE